jgi:hypothetical protein
MIQVAYTFRRETIKHMTFTEDWIRHGSTIGGKPEDARHEGVARLDSHTQARPAAKSQALLLNGF